MYVIVYMMLYDTYEDAPVWARVCVNVRLSMGICYGTDTRLCRCGMQAGWLTVWHAHTESYA